MFVEWALGAWSAMGIAWWIFAWWLVARAGAKSASPLNLGGESAFLSIFKPLPPLGPGGLGVMAPALESFVGQLDDQSEILLGVHEADRAAMAPFVKNMHARYPRARLQIIFRSEPDDVPNPKVAWQKFLAPQAQGELWLWSDADISLPTGSLAAMRGEFARAGTKLLTFPYVVREIATAPALLDALYVNAEFFPGVVLLRRLGTVDFGLGAGLLFRRDEFLNAVDWRELGSALADDFVLGQKLQPVRLSETTLVTAAEVATGQDAILHHLRWSKTVWWNRPAGAMARVLVLPLLGWIVYVVAHPAQPGAWLGLFVMMQIDVIFAALLCRQVGCYWRVRHLPATEMWSLGRIAVWLACWLPWPVIWRGAHWKAPKVNSG